MHLSQPYQFSEEQMKLMLTQVDIFLVRKRAPQKRFLFNPLLSAQYGTVRNLKALNFWVLSRWRVSTRYGRQQHRMSGLPS